MDGVPGVWPWWRLREGKVSFHFQSGPPLPIACPWIPFSSAVLRDVAEWSLPPALSSSPPPSS